MRVFAGPNGSGKSTIFNEIDKRFDCGSYINADQIESALRLNGQIDLSEFGIKSLEKNEFKNFQENHSLVKKAQKEGLEIHLEANSNHLIDTSRSTHSYEAALIADFLRLKLISQGKKLAFETVMSHHSKLDELELARNNGYKNYLYFVCTDSPELNVQRVQQRVSQGGHPVDPVKIVERYHKTLNQLLGAVKRCYRSYLWDNSGTKANLILEVFEGSQVTFHSRKIPLWVDQYLLK